MRACVCFDCPFVGSQLLPRAAAPSGLVLRPSVVVENEGCHRVLQPVLLYEESWTALSFEMSVQLARTHRVGETS